MTRPDIDLEGVPDPDTQASVYLEIEELSAEIPADDRWWLLSKAEYERQQAADAAEWEKDADAWEAADRDDWTADPQ